MNNELKPIYKDSDIEKIKITSLDKLDNNYIRIIGNKDLISVVTNGIFTLNINSSTKVEKIINYNGMDYIILQNIFGEYSLIRLNDNVKLINKVKNISYIDDGLFKVSQNDRYCADKVFDLTTNNYIPFPDNMIFKEYKDNVLILQENDRKKHNEMIINIKGDIILPITDCSDGGIRIIDKTKFIYNNTLIDFTQKTIIQDADLIMPLSDDKLIVLKNRKLFILNDELEIIKTYIIGETKKPWYTLITSEKCIMMTFKKKVKIKKYEPRQKKDITVIINTETDTVNKTDFVPRMSIDKFFPINGVNNKKGLMSKDGEIILEIDYDKIEALYDTDNKYFFVEKNDKFYIFNAETRLMIEVSYTSMKPYKDGLAIGYTPEPKNYQLIDEDLNPIFNLEHMGHSIFYYKDDILCYHCGNYMRQYDAYTIITKEGKILMPPRKCRVKRNGFGLLEINDWQTEEKFLFNMNSGQFEQLELNVPVIETNSGKKLDFSKLPIQQLVSNNEISLIENESGVVKKLLKTKTEE